MPAWYKAHKLRPNKSFHVFPHTFNLNNDGAVSELIAALKDLNIVLLIGDTLRKNSGGMNENDAGAMSEFFNAVDKLREELDCAVLVVHHAGRTGKNSRGSNALDGAIDVLWKASIGPDRRIRLECEDIREAESAPTHWFRVQDRVLVATNAPASQKKAKGASGENLRDDVFGLLVEGKGRFKTQAAWARAAEGTLGMTERTAQRRIKELVDCKEVAKDANGYFVPCHTADVLSLSAADVVNEDAA